MYNERSIACLDGGVCPALVAASLARYASRRATLTLISESEAARLRLLQYRHRRLCRTLEQYRAAQLTNPAKLAARGYIHRIKIAHGDPTTGRLLLVLFCIGNYHNFPLRAQCKLIKI